jgi:hypothetical protein
LSCWLSELYCSYFGVALASILQAGFTGFGNCAPRICKAIGRRENSEIQRA